MEKIYLRWFLIMIKVHEKDSVNLKVECDDRGIIKELSQFFTFTVPGAKYMPSYKSRRWDGKIKLFNIHTQELYVGLYDYLYRFCSDRGYEIDGYCPKPHRAISYDLVKNYINNYLKPQINGGRILAMNHQIDAVSHVINNDRCLLLSPTGSGKSLMIYALLRYYSDTLDPSKKLLIIVPTTSLVSQMHSDFGDYSSGDEDWDVSKECHTVTAGKDKIDPNKRVVISTWQSIHKMEKKYFDNFGVVFGDECHLFKAKSLTSIMTKLGNCKYRVGTTGTLDGTQCHKLIIEGLFGLVYKVASTSDLIKKEILSDFEIECILLKHSHDFRQKYKRVTYQEEISAIMECDARNNFITKLSKSLKGNTLVLFQYVAKHGRPLYEQIKENCPEKDVFFIYGGTETELREKIRKAMENKNNAIIVASYGTFSTGISIRKLHNIVFASPSKSRIRVLQSIGRQLRKSKHKEKARLYDISDDICWKKYKNHTYRHYQERLKLYEAEHFSYKTVVINII